MAIPETYGEVGSRTKAVAAASGELDPFSHYSECLVPLPTQHIGRQEKDEKDSPKRQSQIDNFRRTNHFFLLGIS
jgi:hypothetical protein